MLAILTFGVLVFQIVTPALPDGRLGPVLGLQFIPKLGAISLNVTHDGRILILCPTCCTRILLLLSRTQVMAGGLVIFIPETSGTLTMLLERDTDLCRHRHSPP